MDSRLIHYVSGKQEIDRRALQTSSKLELEQLADKVIVFFFRFSLFGDLFNEAIRSGLQAIQVLFHIYAWIYSFLC